MDEPENKQPQLTRLADLLDAWSEEAIAAAQARATGQPRGPVAGLGKLDTELGGCFCPGVHIVHGTPGVGKTAFCLQLATECKSPALFVTCEMGVLELFRRLTARLTETYLGRLKSGELSVEKSLELAQQTAQKAPLLAIADATQCFAEPSWIMEAALAVRGECAHVLIVIDSVHSWAESSGVEGSNEYESLNAALAALRKLGSSLPCPVLAIAERNRQSMRSGGINAGAGSRKIEYGAESVIDLSSDPEAQPGAGGEIPVTVKLVKNRHGSIGREIELRWHGALQTFRQE